jgi:hypothetical protein
LDVTPIVQYRFFFFFFLFFFNIHLLDFTPIVQYNRLLGGGKE